MGIDYRESRKNRKRSEMLLVVCQLSCDVIGYEGLVISNWCVSIRLLSQLNSRLLLVKFSVLQSFCTREPITDYEYS